MTARTLWTTLLLAFSLSGCVAVTPLQAPRPGLLTERCQAGHKPVARLSFKVFNGPDEVSKDEQALLPVVSRAVLESGLVSTTPPGPGTPAVLNIAVTLHEQPDGGFHDAFADLCAVFTWFICPARSSWHYQLALDISDAQGRPLGTQTNDAHISYWMGILVGLVPQEPSHIAEAEVVTDQVRTALALSYEAGQLGVAAPSAD